MEPSSFSLRPGAVVFLASGQGSQKPGMGADLLDIPEVAATFQLASEAIGRDVAQLVSQASAQELNDTRNAQIAIAALSLGIGRALEARGVYPDVVLGFSLGQITALALAGMVDDATVFEIIRERSACMGAATERHPGAMSALLKGSSAEVEEVVAESAQDEVLVAANYNCPGQVVVSGTSCAVERAEAAWKARGYRASRLATSGGFHSPLMAEAADSFGPYLEKITFRDPQVPLIHNTDALPLDASRARQALVEHLTHPVLFEQSVRALQEAGAEVFIEVGYGGVLTGLVKRIDKTATRLCVQDRASFDEAVENHSEQVIQSSDSAESKQAL